VLVGTQLLGIVGALVAIPVAGIIQVVVQDWAAARRVPDGDVRASSDLTPVPGMPEPEPGPGASA